MLPYIPGPRGTLVVTNPAGQGSFAKPQGSSGGMFPLPGDFKSSESPQTLPALFIGLFENVERFRNLKFAVKRIENIQSTVLSCSEGTAAIHLAFK